jgi:hypothetical protein
MARPKRSSVTLQKAETRQAALQSISPTLDLGNDLTLTRYSALIQTLRTQVTGYNSSLSDLDDFSRKIKSTEQELRDLSEQMLLGVAAKYGKNSGEYGKAGGVPKGERRRSTRSSTSASGSELPPMAIAAPSNGNASTPVNGNGNGNGKVLVS